jgi:hypothetical protein
MASAEAGLDQMYILRGPSPVVTGFKVSAIANLRMEIRLNPCNVAMGLIILRDRVSVHMQHLVLVLMIYRKTDRIAEEVPARHVAKEMLANPALHLFAVERLKTVLEHARGTNAVLLISG